MLSPVHSVEPSTRFPGTEPRHAAHAPSSHPCDRPLPPPGEKSLALFLQKCECDALKRAGSHITLFSMFEQAAPENAQAQACVVWWVPQWHGWLVYVGEVRPYQVTPGENADLGTFIRDLRNHHLSAGVHARVRYRAKLLTEWPRPA